MSRDAIVSRLLAIADERGSALAIAATRDGAVVARVAGADAAVASDLERALFGDADAVRRLHASLQGQRLPRLWAQGPVRCAVWLPRPELVVALVERSDESAVAAWRSLSSLTARLAGG